VDINQTAERFDDNYMRFYLGSGWVRSVVSSCAFDARKEGCAALIHVRVGFFSWLLVRSSRYLSAIIDDRE